MSRIRSVHPGLFTDEAFVSLSPVARIFLIGLWTECDDNGMFEWSPIKLKMRLLPADTTDASALLAEIEAQGIVRRFEIAGRSYGAVRNFCRYQRPKKPNSAHPMTDEVRNYVNINARKVRDGVEEVPHEFPTSGEKSRQMEDGGWRMEDGVEEEPDGSPSMSSHDCAAVITAWNGVAAELGLPCVSKTTGKRKTALKARIAEHGIEHMTEAISRMRQSSFCQGENDRQWRANFDWLLRPDTVTKLLEGQYDGNRPLARNGNQADQQYRRDPAWEGLQRLRAELD